MKIEEKLKLSNLLNEVLTRTKMDTWADIRFIRNKFWCYDREDKKIISFQTALLQILEGCDDLNAVGISKKDEEAFFFLCDKWLSENKRRKLKYHENN